MQDYYCFPTPIGKITVYANGDALTRIDFAETKGGCLTPLLQQAVCQLEEYFAGQRRTFKLPLQPQGTPFQLKVWQGLQQIPYGETCSYKELAEMIGNPKACRAVGGANNKNPLSIIVPCHRVIGANGSLVGYGGGLIIKQQLLELEQKCR